MRHSALRFPHSAFSLVELVISLAILSVGLIGAMRVFPVGLRASQRAEHYSRATMVAQRVLESLKASPWEELKEGQTTTEDNGMQVTTRIRPVASLKPLADPARLKIIEVTVRAIEGDRSRELTFITYLRGGPS